VGYDLDITVPGDPAFAPLAIRAVRDLENLPDGPGEEVMTLVPALEAFLAAALATLAGETPAGSLRIHLETGPSHLSVVLELRPPEDCPEPATVLGDREEEIVALLEAAFDDVERPRAGAPFRMVLTRRFDG
jgi:hypothetical protein